jgi:hypothetical protein
MSQTVKPNVLFYARHVLGPLKYYLSTPYTIRTIG